jgi:threonine dehydrogenase-like Zn-dependent dehydrogenase
MKAAVFHGAKDIQSDNVPDPKIEQPTDVILKVTSTAICGSDLHLYNGWNPTMKEGDILGHEFMGEIVEIGSDVKNFQVRDRVIVPFPIACGECFFCKNNLTSICDNTNPNKDLQAGVYGYPTSALYGYSHLFGGIPGGQAQYVRVLNADANAFKIPADVPDEKLLFLTDIFPTGYMAAENALRGVEIKTVAVFGCGPVGQFTIRSLFLLGAERVIAIDRFNERLEMAKSAGAETINYEEHKDITETLKQLTNGRGPDAVIDAAGMESHGTGVGATYDKVKQILMLETDRPTALRQAIQSCRKGGVVSIAGVFSGFIDKVPMGAAFNKGLSFHMGQTHVHKYLPELFKLIQEGKIDPSFVVTHKLPLDRVGEGYKLFNNKEDNCIKVVLKPW